MNLYLKKNDSSALAYTSRSYSQEIVTQPEDLYVTYDTSFHEKTGNIGKFAQFEEGDLLENETNVAQVEYISASIDNSSTYADPDGRSIITDAIV